MPKLTATDELRRLLDERGVEYEVDDAKTVRVTRWGAYGDWVSFIEYDNGETKFCIDARRLTPEQAVEATLGRGNAGRYVGLRRGEYWERTENSDYYCGGCGWKVTDHDSYCPECGGALHKAALGSCNCSNSERTNVPCLPHSWTHDGALHIELPKLPDSIFVRLPDQRDREVGSARVWQYTLSDADATPTRQDDGTCHDTGTFKSWGLFTCSNCSIVIPLNAAKDAPEIGKVVPLRFCPNCGRKVVDE